MAYDLPNATHMERGVTGIFEYANTVSDGIFVPLFLFAAWFIVFIGSMGASKDFSGSMISASFICGIVAVPFALLGLLAIKWMFLLGILLAIGVFWRAMER